MARPRGRLDGGSPTPDWQTGGMIPPERDLLAKVDYQVIPEPLCFTPIHLGMLGRRDLVFIRPGRAQVRGVGGPTVGKKVEPRQVGRDAQHCRAGDRPASPAPPIRNWGLGPERTCAEGAGDPRTATTTSFLRSPSSSSWGRRARRLRPDVIFFFRDWPPKWAGPGHHLLERGGGGGTRGGGRNRRRRGRHSVLWPPCRKAAPGARDRRALRTEVGPLVVLAGFAMVGRPSPSAWRGGGVRTRIRGSGPLRLMGRLKLQQEIPRA